MQKKLRINPELRDLIPPLQPAELQALEESLRADGCRDPITVWRGTIVDGHNRHEICTRLRLPYTTVELRGCSTLADVKQWMITHQLARRNLTPDQMLMVTLIAGCPAPASITTAKLMRAERLVTERPDLARKVATNPIYTIALAHGAAFREERKRAPKPPPAPITAIDPVDRLKATQNAKAAKAESVGLAKEVSELRAILEAREAIVRAPVEPIERTELGNGVREATWVALLSDFHVEERVLSTDTPTGNTYNLDIAAHRLGRFFSGVSWLANMHRDAFTLRNGLLWLGGDLFSGHIHDENVETSALTPLMTCAWLKPRLIAGINQLLEETEVELLTIPCSYGNHGRDTHKSRRATGAAHSYEYALYLSLAEYFQTVDERRVQFEITPSGHQYVDLYGRTSHFHHGDECQYGGGVGGITIPINKAVAQWDRVRRSHLHHFGHFHQLFDGGHWIVNGSGIGYNAYAMSIKASPEEPRQAFYLNDSRRGKCCFSPVWVGDLQNT